MEGWLECEKHFAGGSELATVLSALISEFSPSAVVADMPLEGCRSLIAAKNNLTGDRRGDRCCR